MRHKLLITLLSISACALVGCSSSQSSTISAQTDMIHSGHLILEDGCRVVTPAGAAYTFKGVVYILPEETYHALLLTP